MALTTHSAYGTLTTALSTELNALANNGVTALGPAQDNSTGLAIYVDFQCNIPIQGTSRTGIPVIELYLAFAVDSALGTYDTILATTTLVYKNPVGVFRFLPGTTAAGQDSILGVEIPPGLWKPYAKNVTSQTLAATLNTIKFKTRSVQTL